MALRIDVGGVDEVDAGVERPPDQRIDRLLLQRADLLPEAGALRRRRSWCRGRARKRTGRCGRAGCSASKVSVGSLVATPPFMALSHGGTSCCRAVRASGICGRSRPIWWEPEQLTRWRFGCRRFPKPHRPLLEDRRPAHHLSARTQATMPARSGATATALRFSLGRLLTSRHKVGLGAAAVATTRPRPGKGIPWDSPRPGPRACGAPRRTLRSPC